MYFCFSPIRKINSKILTISKIRLFRILYSTNPILDIPIAVPRKRAHYIAEVRLTYRVSQADPMYGSLSPL